MNQCVCQKTFPVHKTDTGDAVSLRRLCILVELRLFLEHVAVEKDNMRGSTQRRPAEENGKNVFFRETTGRMARSTKCLKLKSFGAHDYKI